MAHPSRFLQRVSIPQLRRACDSDLDLPQDRTPALEPSRFFPTAFHKNKLEFCDEQPLLSLAESSTMETCAQFSKAPDKFPQRHSGRKSASLSLYSRIFYAQPSVNQYFASAKAYLIASTITESIIYRDQHQKNIGLDLQTSR